MMYRVVVQSKSSYVFLDFIFIHGFAGYHTGKVGEVTRTLWLYLLFQYPKPPSQASNEEEEACY